jgi:hypothetical protein
MVGLYAAVVGAFGPMSSPGFVQVAGELGVNVNTFSQSTAWLVLSFSVSLFIINPIAKVWDRRPRLHHLQHHYDCMQYLGSLCQKL